MERRITTREKKAPAYRKKLEAEIVQLKKSLRLAQDESTNFQEKNIELERKNSVLKERVEDSGWIPLLKDIALLFIGAAIGYIIEQSYPTAATLAIIGFLFIFLYIGLSKYKKK